jgi:hypothetical protein
MSRQLNPQLPQVDAGSKNCDRPYSLYKPASQYIDEKLAQKYGLTEYIKMQNAMRELSHESKGKPVSLNDVCKKIDELFGKGKK